MGGIFKTPEIKLIIINLQDAELERINLEVNGLQGEIVLREKEVEALNTQIKEVSSGSTP